VEVTALGHAGLRVSGARTTGLIDPWFSQAGAFLGAWHQFPDNAHVLDQALAAPNWIAVSSDDDDRCDLELLSRLPPATPMFIPARRTRLSRRLRASTRLLVVEVPTLMPVKLDGHGSWLAFVPVEGPWVEPSALVLAVDGVSLFVWTRVPPSPEHLEWVRSMAGGRVDTIAVQLAVPHRESLTSGLDSACIAVRATDASTVVPYGGPPCFLDPELAHLNDALPSARLLSELLRARLPERHVTSLLPGDQLFPGDGMVLEDAAWESFPGEASRSYLRDYAYRRAVELSFVHSRFQVPERSLAPAFASHVRELGEQLHGPADELRFEVTGPGGGVWDLVAERNAVHVAQDDHRPGPASHIRVASRWLAAVLDGRATWRQLERSFRYTTTRSGPEADDPLLDRLVRADHRSPPSLARSVVDQSALMRMTALHPGG
jgi:hypothetical protein